MVSTLKDIFGNAIVEDTPFAYYPDDVMALYCMSSYYVFNICMI